MATVINNPGSSSDNNSGTGILIGVILFALLVLGLLYFGLPYLRGTGGSSTAPTNETINVEAPEAPSGGGTTIEVPDQIDVNVQGQ